MLTSKWNDDNIICTGQLDNLYNIIMAGYEITINNKITIYIYIINRM